MNTDYLSRLKVANESKKSTPGTTPDVESRGTRLSRRFSGKNQPFKYAAGNSDTMPLFRAIPHSVWRGQHGDQTVRLATADHLDELGRHDEAAILRDTSRHAYLTHAEDGPEVRDAADLHQHLIDQYGRRRVLGWPDTRQYIDTALWSSIDDTGEPLDTNYDINSIHPDTQAAMSADMEHFFALNHDAFFHSSASEGDLGHDFWLSRNGHGSGFWYRPEVYGEYADELSDAARKFGEYDLYVGEDGMIHGSYEVPPRDSDQRMSRRRMARPIAITAIIGGDTYALTPHEDGWSVTKTTNQIDRMVSHYQVRCDPNGDPIMCSCPDHFYRKRVCKHMRAVQSTVDSQRMIDQQNKDKQTQQTEGPEATEKLSRRQVSGRIRFNNHEAFFKALHANNKDATASLVYADFLEENGMPTAADIVRRHVQRENSGPHMSMITAERQDPPFYSPKVEAWRNDYYPNPRGETPASWGIAIYQHGQPYEGYSHYHSHVVRDRLEAARLLDSLESEGLPGVKEAREQSGLRTAAEEEGLGPNDRNYTGGMGGADYSRRRFRRDVIPGGMGDTLQVSDVDPEQLKIGIEVEMEHTKDQKIAREIALDHLKEDPKYYTKLKRAKLSRKRYSAKFGPTYEALVRAIEADPQDQTVRLALADFFEENGYPHHAAYIRKAEGTNSFNPEGTSYTKKANSGDTEYSVNRSITGSDLAIKSYRDPDVELRWALDTDPHRDLIAGLHKEGAHPYRESDSTAVTDEPETEPRTLPEAYNRRRFAAYRAPAGGMIARGTAYKGGMMVPDMEGDFMNPQRKERTPSKIDPSKLARLRVSWGKVKKMPKAAVMNADGTSGPAPSPKKRKLA